MNKEAKALITKAKRDLLKIRTKNQNIFKKKCKKIGITQLPEETE